MRRVFKTTLRFKLDSLLATLEERMLKAEEELKLVRKECSETSFTYGKACGIYAQASADFKLAKRKIYDVYGKFSLDNKKETDYSD